jgi:hypothetical protein
MKYFYDDHQYFIEDLSEEAQRRAFADWKQNWEYIEKHLFRSENPKTPNFEDFLKSCEEAHLLFNWDGSEYKGKWRW